MRISFDGLGEALKSVRAQALRTADLTPVFKTFSRYIEKGVDDCFDASRDWDGKAFPPLAESTIAGRIGNLGAANKRTKSGKFTKGAVKLRGKLTAPGGIKPLVDTARARNSQHCIPEKLATTWTAVGYLAPHVTGSSDGKRPPQRNVSPFVHNGSEWSLHPKADAKLASLVEQHILNNRADAAE